MCQRTSFHMLGVASPSAVISGKDGVRVSFDNDLVPFISGTSTTIKNANRSRGSLPTLGGSYIDYPTLKFHGFSYYMGHEVSVTDIGKTQNVSTLQAKSMITNAISNAILTGELQVAFPCLGDRRFGLAMDSDLIASIPFGIVEEIVEGMEKTHKAGTRYPIPYQISTPEFFMKLKKQLDKAKKN